ncbi:hypothetical protein ACS0PU_009791 [Formica fusca]
MEVVSLNQFLEDDRSIKNSTTDERIVVVDDFCVPNLMDAFHRAAGVAVAAASRVTVVAHANMPGHGDVTSGVSFFAVCTYHRAPREKNEQRG